MNQKADIPNCILFPFLTAFLFHIFVYGRAERGSDLGYSCSFGVNQFYSALYGLGAGKGVFLQNGKYKRNILDLCKKAKAATVGPEIWLRHSPSRSWSLADNKEPPDGDPMSTVTCFHRRLISRSHSGWEQERMDVSRLPVCPALVSPPPQPSYVVIRPWRPRLREAQGFANLKKKLEF